MNKNDREVDGLFVVLKEMQGIDGVKIMVWFDDLIFFGIGNGYSMMFCIIGQINLIFSFFDMVVNLCFKLLWKDYYVFLLVDNVGIIVNVYGQFVGGSLVFYYFLEFMVELFLYVVVGRFGKMELYYRRLGVCV